MRGEGVGCSAFTVPNCKGPLRQAQGGLGRRRLWSIEFGKAVATCRKW